MLGKLYGRWMYRWETALTTRDTNRIVRPVEWGFDWLQDFTHSHGFSFSQHPPADDAAAERAMLELNDFILRHRDRVFRLPDAGGFCPRGAVIPQLFPTNVRPETLQQDARFRRLAAAGQAAQGGVSALYFACAHTLPGERSRQRPLVSAPPKKWPASPSRRSSSCPTGMRTLSATTLSAPSSTASAFPPCV